MDRKRHQKCREGKANAAFQLIKRLTRLPPREKNKIVVSQLMAILTYGAELHSQPSKSRKLVGAGWNRFITGGWRRSNREHIAGVAQLEAAMRNKRVRLAASIYERGVEELKETARHIVEEWLEEITTLIWLKGSREKIQQLEVLEQYTGKGEGGEVFTDGSRMEEQTAAGTINLLRAVCNGDGRRNASNRDGLGITEDSGNGEPGSDRQNAEPTAAATERMD